MVCSFEIQRADESSCGTGFFLSRAHSIFGGRIPISGSSFCPFVSRCVETIVTTTATCSDLVEMFCGARNLNVRIVSPEPAELLRRKVQDFRSRSLYGRVRFLPSPCVKLTVRVSDPDAQERGNYNKSFPDVSVLVFP